MVGLLGWLGEDQSQGLLDPKSVRRAAALDAIGAFGAALAQAGASRPALSPGGNIGTAFGAIGPAYQQSLQTNMASQAMDRQAREQEQWRRLTAQDPTLAGLPASAAQRVVTARLSREPREPPDPRRNFITNRTGIYDISSGQPRLVQGAGMGGGSGGAGGAAGAAGGAFRGTAMDAQAYNILMNGDPASQQYALAYNHVTQPRPMQVPDANGNMQWVEVTPRLPPNIRPPVYNPQSPAEPAPVPANPTGFVAGGAEATMQPQTAAPTGGAAVPAQPPQTAQATPPAAPPATPPVAPSVASRVQPIAPPRQQEVPNTAVTALSGNESGLRRIDRALSLLEAAPSSVGIIPGVMGSNRITSSLWNRADEAGVAARAAIAELSSQVIHDRSGAAVSAAEFPRLEPFIPLVGDSVETIRTKLQGFRRIYEEETAAIRGMYTPERGYRALPPPTARQPGQGGATPEGQPQRPSRYQSGPIPTARDIEMLGTGQANDVLALARRWGELSPQQQEAVTNRLNAIDQMIRGNGSRR